MKWSMPECIRVFTSALQTKRAQTSDAGSHILFSLMRSDDAIRERSAARIVSSMKAFSREDRPIQDRDGLHHACDLRSVDDLELDVLSCRRLLAAGGDVRDGDL